MTPRDSEGKSLGAAGAGWRYHTETRFRPLRFASAAPWRSYADWLRLHVTLGVVLWAAAEIKPAGAGNATVPGEVTTPYPTIINLAVEWMIQGDDNLDGAVTVRFRAVGEEKWREGLPLRRVPAGETADDPKIRIAKFKWPNKHSGSLFDLKPNTEYEMVLKLHDPDGGDAERTVRAKTRPVPRVQKDAPVRKCSPDSLLQALAAAQPGETILAGPGAYGNVNIPKDGEAANPIVFRAEPGATFTGISLRSRKHVFVEGATVKGNGCIDLLGAENCVVRRCTVTLTGKSFGIGANRPPGAKNCYIADNVVIGPIPWTLERMYPDNFGEGIEITGPGNVICYNRVRNCRDNISTMEGRHAFEQISIDIYNNDLAAAGDDAIEADYCMHNCRIMRNRITSSFVGLSSQPGLGGPTYFIRNVMYNIVSSSFKLHCYSVGDVAFHNTVVKGADGIVCGAGQPFDFAYFRNNLGIGGPVDPSVRAKYALTTAGSPIWMQATGPHCSFDYDALGTDTTPFQGQIGAQKYASFADLLKGPNETHAIQVDLSVFGGVEFPTHVLPERAHPDLRPRAGSAAVDKGLRLPNINDGFLGTAPDCGAYEAGQPLPHYGPRPEGMDEGSVVF